MLTSLVCSETLQNTQKIDTNSLRFPDLTIKNKKDNLEFMKRFYRLM